MLMDKSEEKNSAIIDFRKHISGNDAIYLIEFIQACHCSNTLQEYNSAISRLNYNIPYDFFLCSLFKIESNNKEINHKTINASYPQEWLDYYFKNNLYHIDPVLNCYLKNYNYLNWDETPDYMKKDNMFWDTATSFGIINGCAYGQKNQYMHSNSVFSFCGKNLKHKRHESVIKLIVPHLDLKLRQLIKLYDKPRQILTKRELEILNWVKEGKSNWEIATILNISERTIKFHVSSIIKKLNAVNRSQAVAVGIATGIIKY